jgi:hypothetical protein
MFFKYAVIGAVAIAGMMLFLKSKTVYFSFGWLIVVPSPLVTISVAEQPIGLFRQQPRQEQIFIYVWIFIALIELFLVWIPAFAYAIREFRGTSGARRVEVGSDAKAPKNVDGA